MPDSWTQGDGSATDRAWLADWRRRIATLYVEVRTMAAADPATALAHWRATRERLYREHPQSPVPADARVDFRAAHFEHDRRLRFDVAIEPAPSPPPGASPLRLPDSGGGGGSLAFSRIGRIAIPFADGSRTLAVYWMAGYTGGLFIPFRDTTNGTDTYGAGRYLVDAAKSADLGGDATAGTLTVDFNFAYQPSCAFDPRWACPLAPAENRLDLPIRAGERLVPSNRA